MAGKKNTKGGKRPNAGRKAGGSNKWEQLEMAHKLDIVEGWARDGATDKEMMEALGISNQTFYNWKRLHPEFAEALRKGKEIIDRQVETALFKRATGYQYDEVTRQLAEKYNPETGETEEMLIEVKRVTKEVPADTTAAIFWLKNRKPEQWKDKKQIDANLTHNNLDYMSDEELEAEINRLDGNE
jgi:transposase-like protein